MVDLFLRGSGFESVRVLDVVAIRGTEAPVLDYSVLSDQTAEARILIPEETPVGVTEITFVFDGFGADAFFIVSEDSAAPREYQLSSLEGQLDKELTLLLTASEDTLGPFGGVTIDSVELPVLAFEVNEAGSSWAFRVFLPPEIRPGEREIRMYFENYAIREPFLVSGLEADQPLGPSISGYDPNEGLRGTEIELVLQGTMMSELGDLVGINLADTDLEIIEYRLESEELAVLWAYLPPDLPLGETRIIFSHEFSRPYTDHFWVHSQESMTGEPRQPLLLSISPQEADPDSELLLQVSGENLEALGELAGVWIGDFRLAETEYEILTSTTSVVYAYLLENAPAGSQTITVAFENAEISTDFRVRQAGLSVGMLALIGVSGAGVLGVLLSGAWLVGRALIKERPPKEKPEKDRRERQPRFEFKVEPDWGHQTIAPAEGSLTADLDLRFEIFTDPGEQEIETGSGLIDES